MPGQERTSEAVAQRDAAKRLIAGAKPEDGSKVEALRLMRWLVVPVLGLLAVLSYVQYIQRLEDAQREILRHAQEHAQELEAMAGPAEAHVHDLRRLLERNWHDPPHSGPGLRAQMRPYPAATPTPPGARPASSTTASPHTAAPAVAMTTAARRGAPEPDGWTLDEAPEPFRREQGQIWWAPVDRSAPTSTWLDRAAMFLRTARVVHERTPGFQGSYFVAAEANISWGYPWIDTPTMLKAMGVPTLQALEPLRLNGVQRTLRLMKDARGKITYWGEPYAGQLDGDLVQSHGAVLLIDGEYMGEVSVDFRISSLQQLAIKWQDLDGSRVWVVDGAGLVIADSAQPLKASGLPGKANEAIRIPLDTRVPTAAVAALKGVMPSRPGGTFVQRGGWMLITAARSQSPWTFVQAVPMSALRAQVLPTLLPNALLAAALIAVLLAGQWLFARWFVTPALAVLAYLRQLSADPATPRPDLGPRWDGWVRAVTKVFERQRHAQLLLEQQRETLRQNEKLSVMGTLLAGVAHELNNPLAIVMGRASLMEERIAIPAPGASPGPGTGQDLRDLREDARRIRAAAERCGRIVRTFLNMARQRPAARAPVQLGAVVLSGLEMLGYSLRSHGIELERRLADTLPDVQADADQLGQVVLNLIVNAQQALDAVNGARRLVISTGHVAASPSDWRHLDRPYVWLRVADNGPGVPVALREQLFEPFFTTKSAGQGTGLGLSMSRAIAREHGGDLVLEPTPSGASFCLMLPVADNAAAGALALPEPVASPEREAARVLVVDDEPELVELMRLTLELAGFEVAAAESGAVALELLDTARFDAVVSDMRMPALDGRALWRVLRQRHPSLARRLLYVTGDTLSPDARALLAETGCPSLDKPFEREELVRAVRRLLHGE